MLYTEVLDSLESLSNEEIGRMFRLIIKWNRGEVVEPQDSLEKFVWATLLPKLEHNKESFIKKCETASENGKKGGAPKGNKNASKAKTSEGLNITSENNQNQHNYNYNYINSSKEELINTEQPSSSEDESVVSKGLESLEKIFPQGRNYVGIDEVNLWNSLTQEEKKVMIRRASMYVRNEKKKEDGKYIKGMGKWMREQVDKGLEDKPTSMKNNTKGDDPRLFKLVHGQLWSSIETLTKSSKKADELYQKHNKKELYKDAQEMWVGIMNEINQSK